MSTLVSFILFLLCGLFLVLFLGLEEVEISIILCVVVFASLLFPLSVIYLVSISTLVFIVFSVCLIHRH